MGFVLDILREAWRLLEASSIYVLFGIVVAGLLRALFNPSTVSKHLGRDRFFSVIKAALFGIPIPL